MKLQEQVTTLIDHNPNPLLLFHKLSEGRAFTLVELAKASNLTQEEATHLINLIIQQGLLSIRSNRKRIYYFIPREEVRMIIQRIANANGLTKAPNSPTVMKYCRHCYAHLAGFVGVAIERALIKKGYLTRENKELTYEVTASGWEWFKELGIQEHDFIGSNRKLTKQCLDFSERKSHLGGRLGDALLTQLLSKEWVYHVPNSREIRLTTLGQRMLKKELDIDVNVL